MRIRILLSTFFEYLIEKITAARAVINKTNVSRRFPNSIQACNAPSACPGTGVYEPGVHSGQVGQPNPDPVTLTAPPVTINAPCRKTRSAKTLPEIDLLATNMI